MVSVNRKGDYPIPAGLNVCVCILQLLVSVGCLVLASHTENTFLFGLAVVVFAFVMQTGFSILHEAEHDKLHPSAWVNDGFGFLTAAMFPGSYQLLKVAHLNHHKVNRSDAELVDYYRPGENPTGKTIMYYFLITGGVWMSAPLLTLAVDCHPKLTQGCHRILTRVNGKSV